jgi:hypothetical protein
VFLFKTYHHEEKDMPLLIQFYPAKDAALETVNELKRRGLRDKAVYVVGGPEHWSEAGLVRRGIRRENARAYAERLKAGQTMLIVDAPFAGAAVAQEIMDRPRPRPAVTPVAVEGEAAADGVAPTPLSGARYDGEEWKSSYDGGGWSEAAPLSSVLSMPLLVHEAAPFSSFFGLPTLSRGGASKRKPLLNNFFPGKIFGPLLTKSQAPTGFGLLTKSGKPLTPFTLTKHGRPITPYTLTDNGEPLEGGLPLLTRDN